MVVGGVGAAVMLVLFLLQSKAGAHPSFSTIAAILAIMLFFLGVAYTPWMASFTETVEHRNPAAVATGLAIWGWIIRVVVFGSSLGLLGRDQLGHSAGQLRRYRRDVRGPVPVADLGRFARQGRRGRDEVLGAADVRGDARHASSRWRRRTRRSSPTRRSSRPELAVIEENPALFAQAAKYPADKVPPALAAKLIAAAGGGSQGPGHPRHDQRQPGRDHGRDRRGTGPAADRAVRGSADGAVAGAALGDRRGLGSWCRCRTGSAQ